MPDKQKKKYKNVLILGSHVDKITKGIEEYITEDTLVIGDGKDTTLNDLIKRDEFGKLADLDPNTNVSILAHGTALFGKHITEAGSTEDFLNTHVFGKRKPFNVKLFSCYGGAAEMPFVAPAGSSLTTFAEDSRVMYGYSWTQKNMTDTKSQSSLKNSLDNIMEIACQTITLSSIDSNYDKFRAVIRPPKKMLYNLEEIIDYFDDQRTDVISKYNDKKSEEEKLSLDSPFRKKMVDQQQKHY